MIQKEKSFSITQAEWEIMKVIWANDIVTSRQVLEILSDKMDWSISTVKTLLARLVDKHFLSTEKQGKQFIYQALVDEEIAVNYILLDDLNKICHKKKGQALYQLIEKEEFSQNDIDQLIYLLKEKKINAPKIVDCNCTVGQCNCHK